MAVHYGLTRRGLGGHGSHRVTPGLPAEPPQPARAPAAIASAQSGPWNNSTTWVSALIPIAGDTVTVKAGHIVTSNLDVTVGHSPGAADPVQAVLIEATGQLKQTGGIFTCLGDFKCSASDSVRSHIVNGGTFQLGNTAQYQYIQPLQTLGTQPSALFQGSALDRITIRTKSGGSAKAIFRGTGLNKFSLLEAYFTDFIGIGDASNEAMIPSPTSSSVFVLENCTFTNCGAVSTAGVNIGAGATFRLKNVIFDSSAGTTPLQTSSFGALSGGERLIQDVYFDKAPNFYSPRDFTYRRVFVNAGWSTTDASPGYWATMDNCLVRQTTNDLNLNGPVTNSYSLYDNTGRANPHNWQPGTYAIGTYTIDGNIFEFTGTDTVGDVIVIGAPSIATTINILNNVYLPNASGDNSGNPFSALGNANCTINFTHNTYIIGSQGVAVGETYVGHAGMLGSFKSNLAWDTSPRGYLLYDSGTDNNVPDLVASGSADYNCGYNYLTGSNLKGYNDLEFTSGNPGAHDKNVNPSFVDSTRNFAKWDLSLGGAGTVAAALARIKADTSLIPGLISYVKAGFAPTNDALVGAGHDGKDIGAVTVQPASAPVETPPSTEPTPIIQPVPRKAEWYTILHPFALAHYQWYVDNNHPATDAGYDPHGYYDAAYVAFILRDYFTGEETTWDALHDEGDAAYRVYYVDANHGAIPAWRIFVQGMYQRWVRRGDAAAKASLLSLFNAAYVSSNSSTENPAMVRYSREVARSLEVHIYSALTGYTLTTAQVSRRGQHYQWTKGHLTRWANNTDEFCHPFMVGITCKALIEYYENVSADTVIIDLMGPALDYIWTTCWKDTDGAWGKGGAFTYADRPSSQIPNGFQHPDLDQYTQHDLNMMIAPAYGWMYKQTGLAKWRQRGDTIFTRAIPSYAYNNVVWQGGAYLGQANQYISGKQFNQQLHWGTRYFEFAEGQVATTPPTVTPDPVATPPTSYSGLTTLLSLTAGDSTTLLNGSAAATDYNGVVAQWSDKSTFTRHFTQGTDASRPIRASATNGTSTFDVVRFDATDDKLVGNSSAASIGASAGCLIVAVSGKITTTAATMGLFTIYTASAGNPRARCALLSDGQWSTEARRLDSDSTSSVFSGAATTYTTGTWGVHLWVFDFAGGNLKIYFNKVLKASTTLAVTGTSDSTSAALNGVFLGSYNSSSGYSAKDIRQVNVYSGTTLPAQSVIDQIQIDLAASVGVTLPATTTGYPIGLLLSLTKEA